MLKVKIPSPFGSSFGGVAPNASASSQRHTMAWSVFLATTRGVSM